MSVSHKPSEPAGLGGCAWDMEDDPTCSHNPKKCCWNTSPASCSTSPSLGASPGLQQAGNAGQCWDKLQLRDQGRPGDKTPQGPFTSRAKLTSAEGKEEPGANLGTFPPSALPTAGKTRYFWDLTTRDLSLPELPTSCVPSLPSWLTVTPP